MLSIGLLADTHGHLDERVCPTFAAAKVSHILHAGDVADGKLKPPKRMYGDELIATLSQVAPVSAVRGNADDKSNAAHGFPETLIYNTGSVRFVVHHGDEKPVEHYDDDEVLRVLRPADGWRSDGSDVIVYGHSHKPRFVRHASSGVYFLNPGSAAPKRFRLPRQIAVVTCLAGSPGAGGACDSFFEVTAVDLETGASRAWLADEAATHVAVAYKPEGGVGQAQEPAAKSAKRSSATTTAASSLSSCKRTRPAMASSAFAAIDKPAGDDGARLLGTICGCMLKEARGAPMTPTACLELKECLGVIGDVHADLLSPRQVLVAASRFKTINAVSSLPRPPPLSSGSCSQSGDPADPGTTAELGLPPGALRENVHIALAGEASWPVPSGGVLSIGDGGAELRVTFACEPCAKGAKYAETDLDLLSRGWKQHAQRGLLATVVASGTIRHGDEVRLLPKSRWFGSLSSEHPTRVRHILAKVPPGRVLPWTQLSRLAGAPTGFSMRGMPGLLKKAEGLGSPSWRVVDSEWKGIAKHLPEQREKLRAEGVELNEEGEVLNRERCAWNPSHEELYWDRSS